MQNHRLGIITTTAAALLLGVAAHADPIIGTPVENTESTETVGNVDEFGVIGFYIPLSGSASYGDGNPAGDGTDRDRCYYPTTCTGGELTMHLFFEGAADAGNRVTLLFEVLDAIGVSHDQAVMIGDSAVDAATARALNMPVGLVTHGYVRGDVRAIDADFLIDDLSVLPGILRSRTRVATC